MPSDGKHKLRAYYVARPFGDPTLGKVVSHCFIVTGARFLGDPKAKVHSFGRTDSGHLGRVTNKTKNAWSGNTHKADKAFWGSLYSKQHSRSVCELKGDSRTVEHSVNRMLENNWYAAIPISFLPNTANSNSAAEAIVANSGGIGKCKPGDGRIALGAGAAKNIEFENRKIPKETSGVFKTNRRGEIRTASGTRKVTNTTRIQDPKRRRKNKEIKGYSRRAVRGRAKPQHPGAYRKKSRKM